MFWPKQLLFRFAHTQKNIQCGTIGNVEVMHKCFPNHLRMGTTTIEWDKDTEENGMKRGVNMARSTGGREKKAVWAA